MIRPVGRILCAYPVPCRVSDRHYLSLIAMPLSPVPAMVEATTTGRRSLVPDRECCAERGHVQRSFARAKTNRAAASHHVESPRPCNRVALIGGRGQHKPNSRL